MAITVRTGAALKSLLNGQQEATADGATVGEVLSSLNIRDRLCDSAGNLRRHFNIHVNEGEDIRLLQGLDTPVNDGGTVTILSAIAGGGKVVKKIWLTLPKTLVEKLLSWEIGQKFNVVTNIRQASVSTSIGLLGLEVSGERDEVAKALDHLTAEGASVESVELDVVE